MLTAADKAILKDNYKLDVDKLIDAVKADAETPLTLPTETVVMTTTELTTRDENMKTQGKKEGEPIGEQKGKELATKIFKKKLNLPDATPNDPEKAADAANIHLAKGDEGLKEQVKLLTTDKESLTEKLTAAEQRANQASFDTNLITAFPIGRKKDLSDAERLLLIKNNLVFEPGDNNTTIVKKDGVILRHANNQAPFTPKEAIESFFNERGWVEKGAGGGGGGRGGGNNPPADGGGVIMKASLFAEKWKAENAELNPMGPEYTSALGEYAKDKPDFDWHG